MKINSAITTDYIVLHLGDLGRSNLLSIAIHLLRGIRPLSLIFHCQFQIPQKPDSHIYSDSQAWLARRREAKTIKQSVFFEKDKDEVTVSGSDSDPSSPEMPRPKRSVTKICTLWDKDEHCE